MHDEMPSGNESPARGGCAVNFIGKNFKKYTRSYAIHKNRVTDLLTHWGRVTHICVGNLTIIGSDNGLSPGRRQAII